MSTEKTTLFIRWSGGVPHLQGGDYRGNFNQQTLDDLEAAMQALVVTYGPGSSLPHQTLNALANVIRAAAREYQSLSWSVPNAAARDARCPRCGAHEHATHHPACQERDGTPIPLDDQTVRRIVQRCGCDPTELPF